MADVRPYFKLGIADLESIFEAASSDAAICQAVIDELRHRNTDRAAALLARIRAVLNQAEARPGPSAVEPTQGHAGGRAVESAQRRATISGGANDEIVAERTRPRTVERSAATNEPAAILSAWIALEALSPQTYRRPADLVNGDNRCVAPFEGNDLPWFRREQSRHNYQLYYRVILGCIPVDRATDELIKVFGDDEERGRKEREKAALAAVLVDRNGVPLDEKAVGISSFGWALPVALSGDLAGLGAWTTAEQSLLEGLTKQLVKTDSKGNRLPIDAAVLQKAFRWLVAALKLPAELYEEPSFVLRVFHYFKSKNPPEAAPLNSFYLADLARVSQLVARGQPGRALARYLGAEKVAQSSNLLKDPSAIEALIAPSRTPVTRWPSPGGHPLVTLQQAAVNAARAELGGDGAGIVAVNGPPGTGKTTLLRDVVAGCVFDRAAAMARFDDPTAAFRTTGQKVAAGDRAFLHLYSLDETLKGHEVLVASSNNKAVENVSKELPALKAVGRQLAYFKTVSDRLLANRGDDGELTDGEPTWGLIAAVLGNAKNRGAFQQALWWDDDRSLRLYLKAAKGDSTVREIKDDEGNVIDRVVPAVIEAEEPPTPDEARLNWRKVRARYSKLQAEVEAELRALESIRQSCLKLPPARAAVETAHAVLVDASGILEAQKAAVVEAARSRDASATALEKAARLERQAFAERPWWLHRLFNSQRMKEWRAIYRPLAARRFDAAHLAETAAVSHEEAERLLGAAASAVRGAEAKLEEARAALSSIERAVEIHRPRLGSRLVDEGFFTQGHERWNLASPWLPDTLHLKREDLFASALDVHRAFIDVAAQKVSHNLGVLMQAMHAGAFQEEAKKALLGDLWSTLFLVCPVVSTTFASVDRMLGDLPPSSFGWLLVDEAGQGTPQSAVGLLMRAKKAIIVGDPLQIPPVVSLPERLIIDVAKFFGVSPADWLAPEASVQTLADQASKLKAEFRADVGVREVGIPLLVHRRCQEPMFGISNCIAYDGQMVHAAGDFQLGPVAKALGCSRWIDINAAAESKWCPAEGDAVVQLLSTLAAAGIKDPDVYVITPFRIVAQELQRRIEAEQGLLDRLGVDSDDWLRNRVGTIHTFQGKEAEAVIAVLGAPMATQQGARRWAASTPNIFNVMVSRAKQTLYVVGSRAAWSTVGHGKAVAGRINSP
jgi:hypothetical protein